MSTGASGLRVRTVITSRYGGDRFGHQNRFTVFLRLRENFRDNGIDIARVIIVPMVGGVVIIFHQSVNAKSKMAMRVTVAMRDGEQNIVTETLESVVIDMMADHRAGSEHTAMVANVSQQFGDFTSDSLLY
ncbi:hypothetical protein F5Y19DRAFT_477598 [Xylariaceae sp. FL1651]|nr:hypothetical protein F5Y19DRAFT_477598 [Xylariaceae sp. FL1651]